MFWGFFNLFFICELQEKFKVLTIYSGINIQVNAQSNLTFCSLPPPTAAGQPPPGTQPIFAPKMVQFWRVKRRKNFDAKMGFRLLSLKYFGAKKRI